MGGGIKRGGLETNRAGHVNGFIGFVEYWRYIRDGLYWPVCQGMRVKPTSKVVGEAHDAAELRVGLEVADWREGVQRT